MTSLERVSATINCLESDRDFIKPSLTQQITLANPWVQKIMHHRCGAVRDLTSDFNDSSREVSDLRRSLTDEAGVVIFYTPTFELHLTYNSGHDGIILAEDWSIE